MYNKYPVIGILAVKNKKINKFQIYYSVVKWLKNQGCYVLYISPQFNRETILDIFNNIDGLILPGGNDDPDDINSTYNCAKILMDLAFEHGNFPILGICQGLQYLITYYSNDTWSNVKTYINHHNQPERLIPKTDLTNSILHNISIERLSEKQFFFNHNYSINIETFDSHPDLSNTFTILTTSIYNNDIYVSTIQGKNRPFFGVQWHPEKPNFEWENTQNIIRTPISIEIGNSIATFFVEYCKLTNRKTTLSILTRFDIESRPQYVFQTDDTDDVENNGSLVIYLIS